MIEADNEIFETVVQGFDTIEQRGKQIGESGTSGSLPQD